MDGPLYFDHNATTPTHPEVVDAMAHALRTWRGNPASQHSDGRAARRVIEQAREEIVALLGGHTEGMDADQLVFTSGGTEANQLAVVGMAHGVAQRFAPPHQVIVSSVEHPSVLGAAEQLAARGWEVVRLGVDSQGVVDPGELRARLSPATRLVSVMLGNNETGVLQRIPDLATICREEGVAMHTDAVQGVGKIDVHFSELGVQALSFTAHKLHGPVGIGALLLKGGMQLEPQLRGGFQQQGLRAGTESVALVVGLLTALRLAVEEGSARRERMAGLRDRLEELVLAEMPNTVVVGRGAPRLPHTSNLAFPGLDRQAIVMALDQAEVACSTGSACASGSSEPSGVLLAMGCESDVVGGSIRLSLGAGTTSEEVAEVARRILRVCKQLRQRQEG